MATNKIFYRYFLYFILIIGATLFHSCIKLHTPKVTKIEPIYLVPKKELTPKEKVIKAYTDKIGWKEKTGHNDGENIEYILNTVGLKKGDAWCAAFVYTCFYEAGITNVPKSGYSPSWFPKANTYYVKGVRGEFNAQQADVFGIYIKSKGRIGHVGFIDNPQPEDSKCITVEGNTSLINDGSSRDHEGEGVERKRRLKSQINKLSRWL